MIVQLSNNGMWGKGNYFAVNASYSNGYAYHQGNLRKSQVLTGFSYPNLRYAMLQQGKQELCNADMIYFCGQTNGSVIYITYEAYPAYINYNLYTTS